MLGLFVVPAADVTFTRVDSVDGTRSLGNLELDGVWVPDARMLGDPDVTVDATPAVAATVAEATVGMALDTIGVRRCSSRRSRPPSSPVRLLGAEPENGKATVTPTVTPRPGPTAPTEARVASGTPAGTATRPSSAAPLRCGHRRKPSGTAWPRWPGLERTRAIVYQASAAVAERHERATVTASQAKAAAGACQRLIVARSLEIHGRGPQRADAQLWVRRAQSGELLLGSSADHHRVVDEFRAPKRQPASAGLAVLGL